MTVNKKKKKYENLPSWQNTLKIKGSEKRDKYRDLVRELNKVCNMKVTVIPIMVSALGTTLKELVKGTRRHGNKKTNRGNPDYSIIKIGQNTEKSPGDLRRLTVTQTPMRKQQLTLV